MPIPMNQDDPYSPWMNMQNLSQMKMDENASFDPSVQAMLNQNSTMPSTPSADQPMPQTDDPTSFLNDILPQTPQGGGAGGYRPDMRSMNQLLSQLNAKNTEGYQIQKDQLDRLKQYRDSLPKGSGGVDLTGLMQLADAWGPNGGGKVFTSSYKAPETAGERAAKIAAVDQAIAAEGGNLSKEELSALKDKLTGEVAKLHYGGQAADKNEQKQSMADEKSAIAFEKSLGSDTASSRSAQGGAATRLYGAHRLNKLISGVPDPNNLSPQNVSEIAIGLNSLLAPGNPNVTMYEDIVPKSAQGSVASIRNYIENIPGGANQGKFVKNLSNTINREMKVSQDQISDYYKTHSLASGGLGWAQRKPELFRSIVKAHLQAPTLTDPGLQNSDTVNVKSPDGKMGTIPRANLEKAISKGYQEIK